MRKLLEIKGITSFVSLGILVILSFLLTGFQPFVVAGRLILLLSFAFTLLTHIEFNNSVNFTFLDFFSFAFAFAFSVLLADLGKMIGEIMHFSNNILLLTEKTVFLTAATCLGSTLMIYRLGDYDSLEELLYSSLIEVVFVVSSVVLIAIFLF